MIKKLFLNDRFILLLIVINTVVLIIAGYSLPGHLHTLISILDNAVTVLFIVELLIKVNEFGFKSYLKSNWNKLDFVLVLLALPALFTMVFGVQLFDVSYLLVFRILRVFKVFRFFKFIPNVGELVNGIQRALKASVFVFAGFVIYILIIGIFSFYLFKDAHSGYFEDPLMSLYSIFKIFTVEGWSEIPEKVVEGYSAVSMSLTYLYFIFVVLSGGIFGLSLVNSIFVDSMVSDNNDDLEKKVDDLNSKVSEILTKLNSNETRKNS
ncbi:ion transporter [uncultured Draconibacterium sp.]|uniref:ion transporter n=1 Tax=uncultured Draconibacterium sp. TaxID=1573823 RepID=UPI0029C8597C|nr:ion transporter [uncultured Draconibacterium sp.]